MRFFWGLASSCYSSLSWSQPILGSQGLVYITLFGQIFDFIFSEINEKQHHSISAAFIDLAKASNQVDPFHSDWKFVFDEIPILAPQDSSVIFVWKKPHCVLSLYYCYPKIVTSWRIPRDFFRGIIIKLNVSILRSGIWRAFGASQNDPCKIFWSHIFSFLNWPKEVPET